MSTTKPTPSHEAIQKGIVAHNMGARVFHVGTWIWAAFESQPTPEVRAKMKELGFHFHRRRITWQLPGNKGSKGSPLATDELMDKYAAEGVL